MLKNSFLTQIYVLRQAQDRSKNPEQRRGTKLTQITQIIFGKICDHLRAICDHLRLRYFFSAIENSLTAFTLVEILVTVLIFSFVVGGLFAVLITGQNVWYTSDTAIELQQNLRNSSMRLNKELHSSGFKCNNPPDCTNTTVQLTILDNAGLNNTDILRFKIPVDYNQDSYIKNNSGIVELWGANLTWGCSDYSCQKPLSPEPQSNNYQIEYLVAENKQLLRRVLDDSLNPIRTEIYANNIQNFQVSRNGNILTLQFTVEKLSVMNRAVNSDLSIQVLLRNKG